MRRFWFGVAAAMGVLLVSMIVYYGKALYDYNEEAKMHFKDGSLFKH